MKNILFAFRVMKKSTISYIWGMWGVLMD